MYPKSLPCLLLLLLFLSPHGAPLLCEEKLKLWELPMIVTHDAGSGYLPVSSTNLWANTQGVGSTLTKQLECGARGFDLRPFYLGGGRDGLIMHHGMIRIHTTVREAVEEVKAWVNSNPTELILLLFSHFSGPGLNPEDETRAALTDAGVNTVSDCAQLEDMTVAAAKAEGRVEGGGSILAVFGCVEGNYRGKAEEIKCYVSPMVASFWSAPVNLWGVHDHCPSVTPASLFYHDFESGGGMEDIHTAGTAYMRSRDPSCFPTPSENDSTEDGLMALAASPSPSPGWLGDQVKAQYCPCYTLSTPLSSSCPSPSTVRSKLFSYMYATAEEAGRDGGRRTGEGPLWMLQAHWEYSLTQYIAGYAYDSSVVEDSKRSQLNTHIAGSVLSLKNLNLLEVDDVCSAQNLLREAVAERKRRICAGTFSSSSSTSFSSSSSTSSPPPVPSAVPEQREIFQIQ